MSSAHPTVYILYHFFYPDNVISAEHKKELAQGLVARGWEVTVLTSNRFCRDQKHEIDCLEEHWSGMRIIRVPRKQYNQSSMIGRLRNSAAMQGGWLRMLKSLPEPDVLILGTDPQFSQFMFPALRKMMPGTRLVLWGFDLYPDILEAMGSPIIAAAAKGMRPVMKRVYDPVSLLADIGPCMRSKLSRYAPNARRETLVPWALVELDRPGTPDPHIREELFGKARLGILYSGTIGQAHTFDRFILLARRLRALDASVAFCFAGRGNRYAELQKMISNEDTNIRFAGFCRLEELEQRLNAADLHMISLRAGWEGTVVPSKFFGALATGKPVLYDGAVESDIGIWVSEHDLGIVLSDSNLEEAAQRLISFSESRDGLLAWQQTALNIYNQQFSSEIVLNKWDHVLRSMMNNS
jgi:glycosyltransferase involved in cell wall biosynthesis